MLDRTGVAAGVTQNPGQFVIEVDGRTVGLADYHDVDGRRIFPHTEVLPAYRGRGLASLLIGEALRATRAAGLRIVPTCWAVAEYIDKHPEYAEITDRN